MVETKFLVRHSYISPRDNYFPSLQDRGNSWFSVSKITYTSASSFSNELINNHHYMKTVQKKKIEKKTMPIKSDQSNTCQIMERKD